MLHGLTDKGILDVLIENETATANNIGYGDFSGYKSVPAGNHTLHVTDYANTDTLGSFTADWSARGGQAATIFISGFSNPSANNNGPAMGVYAAFPDGTVIPLTNSGVAFISGPAKAFTKL
jgi:hypothetical protein